MVNSRGPKGRGQRPEGDVYQLGSHSKMGCVWPTPGSPHLLGLLPGSLEGQDSFMASFFLWVFFELFRPSPAQHGV